MDSFKIIVKAERSVAFESPDHLNPWGTARDNSRNGRFNEKLYRIFSGKNDLLKVLDMGCSGGGFVKNCLDDGCVAVGLEGSDYSKKWKRAEWRTIPENLFTCDITSNFDVFWTDENNVENRIIFDAITCWEVMEHIKEKDIAKIAVNVKKHLSNKGIWIMSVAESDDIINGINLHQTVQPKSWWINKFKELGFDHLPEFEKYFHDQYIRSKKYGAPDSFHLILSYDKSNAPKVPSISFVSSLLDRCWYGSKSQKRLKRLILG